MPKMKDLRSRSVLIEENKLLKNLLVSAYKLTYQAYLMSDYDGLNEILMDFQEKIETMFPDIVERSKEKSNVKEDGSQ